MRVPFLDLRVQHEPLMTELVDAFRQVTETSAFAGGPFVARFETEFAAFCGTRHALGVGSGTDALWLTLLALGVGPGDEVITVPNSFMATAEAISLCGARPVFVDVDARSCTMDPAQVEAAITLRTQAIVPVHLFGQMADMEAILAVARRHGTPVVEDACRAHGAEQNGRRASSLGGGLAFLIDLTLDRTIKRSLDVERHLRLPVWLTIPDTEWTRRLRWRWLPAAGPGGRTRPRSPPATGPGRTRWMAVAPWDATHHLQSYAEGLRERIMTFFDIRERPSFPRRSKATCYWWM